MPEEPASHTRDNSAAHVAAFHRIIQFLQTKLNQSDWNILSFFEHFEQFEREPSMHVMANLAPPLVAVRHRRRRLAAVVVVLLVHASVPSFVLRTIVRRRAMRASATRSSTTS